MYIMILPYMFHIKPCLIIKKKHPEVEMPEQFQSIFIVIHFLLIN
jgi:hypothetical protein